MNFWIPISLLTTALAGALPSAVAQTASSPVSAAEQIVFVDAQLQAIKPPQTLRYQLTESGKAQPASILLTAAADGSCCHATGQFPPEPGGPPLPPVENAVSNPVLLYFLEREVRQLQQRTKGQSAHFRRRIRLALAESAVVTPITVRWMGTEVPGTAVTVTPFVNDPYRARFEAEAGTQYRFVLAKAVPGTLVQARALPTASGAPASPGVAPRILTAVGAEVVEPASATAPPPPPMASGSTASR